MDPATILAAASAALSLVEKLTPVIENLFATGQISAAEQQKVRDAYLALKAKGDAAFTGQEWTVGK